MCGVGQLTPLVKRVALVSRVLEKAVKAQKNWPSSTGRLPITRLSCKVTWQLGEHNQLMSKEDLAMLFLLAVTIGSSSNIGSSTVM